MPITETLPELRGRGGAGPAGANPREKGRERFPSPLPAEDLGLSSLNAHPTINEQPECNLNFNDITDAALLIAHLLIWNEF